MIEELKLVLETIGDLGTSAVWLAIGFIGFKLIMYLSTTGAVVYLIKMSIEKLHNYLTSPSVVDDVKIKRMVINGSVYSGIIRCLEDVRARRESNGSEYFHSSDVEWLKKAIEEKINPKKGK